MIFDKEFDISLYQMLMSGYKRDKILEFINLLPEEVLINIRKKLMKIKEKVNAESMTYIDYDYVSIMQNPFLKLTKQ